MGTSSRNAVVLMNHSLMIDQIRSLPKLIGVGLEEMQTTRF
jgi:hypothetical protein